MQRRGLGILFIALGVGFLLVAVAPPGTASRGWIVAVAAAAIAAWFGSMALSAFRQLGESPGERRILSSVSRPDEMQGLWREYRAKGEPGASAIA